LSSLGEGSTLESGATLDVSIAWEHVHVGAGAVVRASILADGVIVGEGATLDGVVAGSGARFPAGASPARGTVVQPGETYAG
jgi:NDP-sugar pyrophosphorylase family protein